MSYVTRIYEATTGHYTGIVFNEKEELVKIIQFLSNPFETTKDLIESARNGFPEIVPITMPKKSKAAFAQKVIDYGEVVAVIRSNSITFYDMKLNRNTADMFGQSWLPFDDT